MERLVLVHGSVVGASATWRAQQPLADRFELLPVERPGFPPGPDVDRVDFEQDANLVAGLLRSRDHLVGHSYGGVISLLAAAARPALLRSLTVIEPPATRVALGDPATDAFGAEGQRYWAEGPTNDPEAFLRGFLRTVGSVFEPPSPLPPELAQGARTLLVQRGPWEAAIPLDELAAAPFSKLVVSGAHHPAFDAICDALERRLSAERAAAGLRPLRAAAPGVQRGALRVRRARRDRLSVAGMLQATREQPCVNSQGSGWPRRAGLVTQCCKEKLTLIRREDDAVRVVVR